MKCKLPKLAFVVCNSPMFQSDQAIKVVVAIKYNRELQKLQPVRVRHAAETYWQLSDCNLNSLFNEACNITGNQTQIKRG